MAHAMSRRLLVAAMVSVLAHIILLGSEGFGWTWPEPQMQFPIEARLVAPEPPTEAVETVVHVAPRPLPARLPSTPQFKPPSAAPSQLPVELPPTQLASGVNKPNDASLREPDPQAPVAQPVQSAPEISLPAKPSLPEGRRQVRQLPSQFKMTYAVQMGDAGFTAGRATYIWHTANGRYSLVNTIEATGLASLFMSGRIVQLSEGEVGESGLRPEQYWLQRSSRKQDTARFNWAGNQLVFGGGQDAVALVPQAQDLLGFPFHLAVTAREGEADFSLGVTNGKGLRDYTFRVLGRETIRLGESDVEALHLQGRREGEGSLDVWLDPGRGGIPLRIQTLDMKGKVIVLVAEGEPAVQSAP